MQNFFFLTCNERQVSDRSQLQDSYDQRKLCLERSLTLPEPARRLQVFRRWWASSTRSECLVSTHLDRSKTTAQPSLAVSSSRQESGRSSNSASASRTVQYLRRYYRSTGLIQPMLDESYVTWQLDSLWSCLWSSNVYRAWVQNMRFRWATRGFVKISNIRSNHRFQSQSCNNCYQSCEMNFRS